MSFHDFLARLSQPYYGFIGLFSSLITFYLVLIWQSGDTAHAGMSLMFLVAAGNLLWEQRSLFTVRRNGWAMAIGLGLVGSLFWQGAANENLLRLMPFTALLGLTLLFSGFKGLKACWQPLLILFFLGAPRAIASVLVDISPATAGFSTLLLLLFGFDASLQGMTIRLPTGSVEVYAGCSGIESMCYLLGLSVVCLVLLPLGRLKRYFIPPIALLTGFVVNCIRVALLAVLVASGDRPAFLYWHTGDGSLLFGAAAVLIFGAIYLLLLRFDEAKAMQLD